MRASLLLTLVSFLILSGCGTSRQSIPMAAIHEPIPDGHVRVVIARKGNLIIAQAVMMEVRRDGRTIGALAPDGFIAWDQLPGLVNVDIEGSPVPLTLEIGKVTCLEAFAGFNGVGVRFIDSENYLPLISAYKPAEYKSP